MQARVRICTAGLAWLLTAAGACSLAHDLDELRSGRSSATGSAGRLVLESTWPAAGDSESAPPASGAPGVSAGAGGVSVPDIGGEGGADEAAQAASPGHDTAGQENRSSIAGAAAAGGAGGGLPCLDDEDRIRPGYCYVEGECFGSFEGHPERDCVWCNPTVLATDWTPKPESIFDGCWIEGECYSRDETDPANDCRVCAPEADVLAWTDAPSGRQCGASPGACEEQDLCDGVGHCVERGFKDVSVVCRSQQRDCDEAEHCTGDSAECPADRGLSEGSKCRACHSCVSGECVANSSRHEDCGTCQQCDDGQCVDQPSGDDRKDECSPHTCTAYTYGQYYNSCATYLSATSLNGNCNGNGACAEVTQSCSGAGTSQVNCVDTECVNCPAGLHLTSFDSLSEACFNDSLQHGCAAGRVCQFGECL